MSDRGTDAELSHSHVGLCCYSIIPNCRKVWLQVSKLIQRAVDENHGIRIISVSLRIKLLLPPAETEAVKVKYEMLLASCFTNVSLLVDEGMNWLWVSQNELHSRDVSIISLSI